MEVLQVNENATKYSNKKIIIKVGKNKIAVLNDGVVIREEDRMKVFAWLCTSVWSTLNT